MLAWLSGKMPVGLGGMEIGENTKNLPLASCCLVPSSSGW